MRVDFDTKTLESLTIPQGKQKVTLTDTRTRGLQFELRQSGGYFNYRYTYQGRQRGIPIGRFGVLKCWRRLNLDSECRFFLDRGLAANIWMVGC